LSHEPPDDGKEPEMGEAADVMRRKIDVFNAQDGEQFAALLSPDVEWSVPGAHLRSPEHVVAYFSPLWEAFPDLKLTITQILEEGPVAVVLGRCEGTHLGTFSTPGGDIPSTGQRLVLTFSDGIEVAGGRIRSGRCHFDRLELLEQLGVAPVAAPA
jgi:ketosteroid isomerase-like protein